MRNINQIIREQGDSLIEKKNVVGVAKGLKNGVGAEALVVLVQSKVTADALEEKDLIPSEIDGVPTDVIEVGDLVADAVHTEKERPVFGGLSCIWEKGTACTLGAIVFKDGKRYALMNTHCVNPHWKGAKPGDEVRQPSPNDGGRNADRIGVSSDVFQEIKFDGSNNPYDAGLCAIDDKIEVKELYQEGIGVISQNYRSAEVGEVVKKSGRTTGVTQTTVLLTNATVRVNYDGQLATFVGQTIVENAGRHFGAGGDSSSLIVDKDNNPVGLHFAGSDSIGIYSPIKPIVDTFGITFSENPAEPSRYIFTKTLRIGAFGDEVVELQKRLRELGFFTYPTNTGYFGTVTQTAVQEYQCSKGIVCAGDPDSTGYGQVGRLTRASLNGEEVPADSGLFPIVDRMKVQLREIMDAIGQPIVITSAYRSIAEQDYLYAQGRTRPGSIVTNAKGGESLHNWRCAFDIAFIGEAQQLSAEVFHEALSDDLKTELVASGAIHYNGDWDMVAAIAKELGLSWGGDWASFIDKPHFEYTAGYSLADFQAGEVDESKFADYLTTKK